MPKKKIFITVSFACPLRILDSVKLKNYFSLNDCIITPTKDDADFLIYITCSATTTNVTEQLNTINDLKNNKGELIIMGCLPGTNEEELKNIFSGKTIATKQISEIDKFFPEFKIKYSDVPNVYHFDNGNFVLSEQEFNSSYFQLFLKYGFSRSFFRILNRKKDFIQFKKKNIGFNISDPCFLIICSGCSNNCTYCNIRDAIGKVKSKTIEQISAEYSGLLKEGFRVFYFLAEDLCSYGLDTKQSLSDLFMTLSEIDKSYSVKWSLNGMNPAWMVKNQKILEKLIKTKKLWEITVSIENGSDRIIELMNRHYKINDVEKVVLSLRKIYPALKLNAMLIIGFPSETEEDIQKTMNFLKNTRFDNVTLTKYSEFKKRASAQIFPKVSDECASERIQRIHALLKKIKTPVIRGDI